MPASMSRRRRAYPSSITCVFFAIAQLQKQWSDRVRDRWTSSYACPHSRVLWPARRWRRNKMKNYDPADQMLGRFTSRDGTIEFYNRINALLQPDFKVLDLGAGRGAWYYSEKTEYKRMLRNLRGKVREYIGADVDSAVLANPTTDRNVLI